MIRRSATTIAVTGVVAGFFVFAFAVPTIAVYVEAFRDSGITLPGAIEVLGSARVLRVAAFSLFQATLSSAVGVLTGLPLAYLVSHFSFPGRRLLLSMTLIPFVLPSIVVVVAIVGFFGRSGVAQQLLGTRSGFLYGLGGIVLAHVYYNFSLGVRVVAPSWSSIDRKHRELAASLGESPIGILRRVTFPLLRPALLNGFMLMFVYTFLSFGIILVFGGVQSATLEVAIYQAWFFELDLVRAALLSLLQLLLLSFLLMLASRRQERTETYRTPSQSSLPRLATLHPFGRLLAGLYLLLIAAFVAGPLLTMLVRALAGGIGPLTGTIGVGTAARSMSSVLRSSVGGVALRSVLIALCSATLSFAGASAIALSFRRAAPGWVGALVQLPLGMSIVTVAVGATIVWRGVFPDTLLVIVIQTVVALPLVYRIVQTGVRELSDRPRETAQSLGAGRLRLLLDVELPLLRPVLVNGFAYGLALSFADLTAVLTVGRGRITTFPVAIYRLIGFRSFDAAIVLASFYLSVCGLLFWIIERSSARPVGAPV